MMNFFGLFRKKKSLKNKSEQIKKTIYCLFDSGAIVYNSKTKELNTYGEVAIFKEDNKYVLEIFL